ncbi:MAG: DNA repair protein RecO [Cloacibacillus porcorum]|nr:DNA repair protein RecO [Cloacibacillus porcorum]
MIPVRLPQGHYSKTGTVLLRRDSSREGQSILLFMREFGPRWVSAPAATGKNRFGGSTEPLTWGEFLLYQSPSKLYLQGAEVKEDFLSLRQSPAALLCALRIYRRTSKEAPADCENDALLRMLWSSLVQLREKCPPYIVELRFTWKLLNLMGIAPSLDLCVECGGLLTEGGWLTQAGMCCRRCSQGKGEAVSAEELAELRRAVALPHEKFILWSCETRQKDCYIKNLKMLSPYFSNMR